PYSQTVGLAKSSKVAAKAVLDSREERQRPHLDALARRGIRTRRRVVERAVRGEARASRVGIVALEEHHLVRLHPGEVEPAVRRIVAHRVHLAGAVAVSQI